MGHKPGPTCSIDCHPRRAEIDAAVSRGAKLAPISRDFAVSVDALRRHVKTCNPRSMELAASAVGLSDLISGAGLTAEAASVYLETRKILAEAKGAKNLKTALDAIGRALEGLALLGRMTGRMKPDTQVNVLVMPEWLGLRDRILDALEPFPDALAAVQEAVSGQPR